MPGLLSGRRNRSTACSPCTGFLSSLWDWSPARKGRGCSRPTLRQGRLGRTPSWERADSFPSPSHSSSSLPPLGTVQKASRALQDRPGPRPELTAVATFSGPQKLQAPRRSPKGFWPLPGRPPGAAALAGAGGWAAAGVREGCGPARGELSPAESRGDREGERAPPSALARALRAHLPSRRPPPALSLSPALRACHSTFSRSSRHSDPTYD
ncbi:hypothetical protein P7K49_007478 [Saguinus oedipus]|uniref:Uncharacterized protein n=1 Tax=Saguinus oedipus TaxID=9490 RepID=A0ABQ9VYJ9_SAGOE|nr:hypothetical protein P7K49_007478 [Saguinus oedipus]